MVWPSFISVSVTPGPFFAIAGRANAASPAAAPVMIACRRLIMLSSHPLLFGHGTRALVLARCVCGSDCIRIVGGAFRTIARLPLQHSAVPGVAVPQLHSATRGVVVAARCSARPVV